MSEHIIKRTLISEDSKQGQEILKKQDVNVKYRDQYHINVVREVVDPDTGVKKKISVVPYDLSQ